MDLRDGGSGDRITKFAIDIFNRLSEFGGDDGACLTCRERRQAVLQQRHTGGKFRTDNIGTRRKKLPEFNVGGAEFSECRGKAGGRGKRVPTFGFAFPRQRDFRQCDQSEQTAGHLAAQFQWEQCVVAGQRAACFDETGHMTERTEHYVRPPRASRPRAFIGANQNAWLQPRR